MVKSGSWTARLQVCCSPGQRLIRWGSCPEDLVWQTLYRRGSVDDTEKGRRPEAAWGL